jgi:hypothetical protein
MQRNSIQFSRIVVMAICLASLYGCAGRAKSTLSYTPPERTAEVPREFVLHCDVRQARNAVMRYFDKDFAVKPEPSEKDSRLVFTIAVPEEDLQAALDCGVMSSLSPARENIQAWGLYEKTIMPTANDKADVFPASTPRNDFFLADGTSTPKPARKTAKAKAHISMALLPEKKGRTLIKLQASYVMEISLYHYVMVSGFSPVAPERISKVYQDTGQIAFDSGAVGEISAHLPASEHRWGINGDWPVQCVSTGALEKKIIGGIKKTLRAD